MTFWLFWHFHCFIYCERTRRNWDYSVWGNLHQEVLQSLITFKSCEIKNCFFKKCLKFVFFIFNVFWKWKLQKYQFTLNLTLIPVYYVFSIPLTWFSQTLRSYSLKLTIQDHVEFSPHNCHFFWVLYTHIPAFPSVSSVLICNTLFQTTM